MQDFRRDTSGNCRFGFLLLTKDTVISNNMAHFVGDNSCDFRGIIGKRQQAARYIKKAAGQCEGIDIRTIKNSDAIGLIRLVGNCRQIANDLGNHALKPLILVFAAIGGKDAWVLLRADLCQTVVAGDVFNRYRI